MPGFTEWTFFWYNQLYVSKSLSCLSVLPNSVPPISTERSLYMRQICFCYCKNVFLYFFRKMLTFSSGFITRILLVPLALTFSYPTWNSCKLTLLLCFEYLLCHTPTHWWVINYLASPPRTWQMCWHISHCIIIAICTSVLPHRSEIYEDQDLTYRCIPSNGWCRKGS